jgi:paraquat-inducible protein B
MNSELSREENATELPQAVTQTRRRISLVWLIPIVAAIAGIWLVWTTIAERGPTITILMDSASGIEPGKTPIKYRDVQLGVVKTVTLGPNLQNVRVTAEMQRDAEDQLREGTTFWVESARITAGGVSGLGTLLSGAYIVMRPGPGQSARHFTALETPPVYQVDVPGKRFVLRAESLGSVSGGAPIYFRGILVGSVLGHELDPDGKGVNLFAFVRAPYDALVRSETRFWNASGIAMALTAAGVTVRTQSLEAILAGGIAFETPVEASASPVAQDNDDFPLYASYDAIQQALYTLKVPFVMYFDESVAGLDHGAPVLLRGIKMGEVTDVRLVSDPATATARIRVAAFVEPQRWTILGDPTPTVESMVSRLPKSIALGLRGKLDSGNLLTGQKVVSLVTPPDAPHAELTYDDGMPVLPTIPSDFVALSEKVNAFLDKLEDVPVAELVADVRDTVQQAERLVASPSVRQAVDGLREVGPLLESLRQTADAARATLQQADQTLLSAGDTLGPDSALRFDLVRLVKELTGTARSLRTLAEFLENNPNALILGKPSP